MAACDVWKQTHKNSKDVWSSTATTSMLKPQEMFYGQSNAQSTDELVSSSIFLNEEGNCVDSYDNGNGNDDFHKQIVACWNMETHSFDYKLSDYLWRNIFNDLLNQGQVTLSDGEYDSSSESSDDTTFGMLSSDTDEDEDKNYFDNTHFNCLPVLMMEWHEHQYVYDEDGIISDVLDAHSCVQSGITMYNDELNTICTNDPYTINHGSRSALDDEDRIFVPSTVIDSSGVSNSSGFFNDIVIGSVNFGEHSVSEQQQQTQQAQLNLEIDSAIIFPSGFYSLQQFLDDLTGMLIGDQVSISFLNKLEFVFVNSNASYAYCPFVLHDDYNFNAETCSLQSLVYIFEDLDIEYGDMIGVSHFDNILNLSAINNVTNMNNKNIDSLLSRDSLSSLNSYDNKNSKNNSNRVAPVLLHGGASNDIKNPVCAGIDFNLDGVHSAPIQQQQQLYQQHVVNKLELETTSNLITFPHGFCPLQDFLDDIKKFSIRFGEYIGASVASVNTLELVFVTNNDFVILPFRIPDDFDIGGEFVPLDRLVNVFEDLDIEYGDSIGISSSYHDVKFLFLKELDTLITETNPNSRSMNINHNITNNQFHLSAKKKRGKKKKKYKWIIKNHLQNPGAKMFCKNNNTASHGSISSSDYHRADGFGDMYQNQSNSLYGTSSLSNITARAPPCDPDMIT